MRFDELIRSSVNSLCNVYVVRAFRHITVYI